MKLRSVYSKLLPALIFALLTSAFSACGFSEDETAARPAQVDESVDDISVGESSTAPTLPEAGVNIGGLGTLIASMASLISYKAFVNSYPRKKVRYFIVFTLINIAFLAVLCIVRTLLVQ